MRQKLKHLPPLTASPTFIILLIADSFTPSLKAEDDELGLWSGHDSSSLPLLHPQVAFLPPLWCKTGPDCVFSQPPGHIRRLCDVPASESSTCLADKDLINASAPKTKQEPKNGCVHISFPSGFCEAVCKWFGEVGFPSREQTSG